MPDDDMPSDRRTGLSRRHLLAVTTGTMLFPVGHTAASAPESDRTRDTPPEQNQPGDTARAYIEALDAGNRTMANELIAPGGKLDPWSRQEFNWVDSFDIDYVGFETVEQHKESAIADITVTVAGNSGTVRYRFRKTESGWMIWEAIDGFRSTQTPQTNAEAVAEAYVAALDAGNRGAVNELIADDGELSAWSSREFGWVGAFDFEFVSFTAVRTDADGDEVIGDIEIEIGGERETVRYRFRETSAGSVELWASIGGLRTSGKVSAEAAAEAYVAALDDGDKEKANGLIADGGQLEPWSDQDLEWVQAFPIELVDFAVTERQGDSVVAELTIRLADATEPVTYEFRRVENGWKLWAGLGGIR
jgi:hypothetical protein